MKLYSGDLTPKEAWKLLSSESQSLLIDVRTSQELRVIGYVDLSTINKSPIAIEWRLLPNMQKNPNFAEHLLGVAPNRDVHLVFLCKTGGRSQEAAMLAYSLGYMNAYNILDGFEGDLDNNSQRGNVSGWKADKLPWRQD
jgi:rhodanese-related sulfurtransferase